jgi:hypothetical protein
MKKYIYSIIVCTPFLFYSCKKEETEKVLLPRLQKIVSNGMDSLGNFHAAPLSFQFFTYDINGSLVSIRDSSDDWHPWYSGPQPWRLGWKQVTMGYNYGNLLNIKNTRDSFVYNNRNQLVARLKRIYSDTSQYFVVNRFTYNIQGNLVADSNYILQSNSKPDGILNAYDQYTYNDRGNVTTNDHVELWPAGTVKHTSYTATYDNQQNPYKNFGMLPYILFYNHGFFLSTNNKIESGYSYEYYPNGLLKKITYQGYVQEYFYD